MHGHGHPGREGCRGVPSRRQVAPGGNVCLWSTEPHRLKIYLKMRSTSGELADCLEGRKSNGGDRRTLWGLVVKSFL